MSSAFRISRLLATCCLLLVSHLVSTSCRPGPEDDDTDISSTSPPLGKTGDSPLGENDYPEMMTEFLKLTTIVPIATSTKKPDIASTNNLSLRATVPSTTQSTTMEPIETTSVSSIIKAFVAPATLSSTTANRPATTNSVPVIVASTEQPMKTNVVVTNRWIPSESTLPSTTVKSTLPSETLPWSTVIPATSKQTVMTTDTTLTSKPTTSKLPPKTIPFSGTVNEQSLTSISTEQLSTTEQMMTSTIRPQTTSVQTLLTQSNQNKQQQMAVQTGSPVLTVPLTNNNNLVQTAASTGPTQQVNPLWQRPALDPQFQPLMPNRGVAAQPIKTMIQQPMMANSAAIQQRPVPFSAQAPLVNGKPMAPMAPMANQLVQNQNPGVKMGYIRTGGSRTPVRILPPLAWQGLVPLYSPNGRQMLPHPAVASA